jgi:hypothetical protein
VAVAGSVCLPRLRAVIVAVSAASASRGSMSTPAGAACRTRTVPPAGTVARAFSRAGTPRERTSGASRSSCGARRADTASTTVAASSATAASTTMPSGRISAETATTASATTARGAGLIWGQSPL